MTRRGGKGKRRRRVKRKGKHVGFISQNHLEEKDANKAI